MDSELTYKVAFSVLSGINAEMLWHLAECDISHEEFFTLNMPDLCARSNLKPSGALQNNARQEALFRARKELEFINRHGIRVLHLLDDDYPYLLKEIKDAPVTLFVLGGADLNASPSVSIVGTRRCTGYGMNFCQQFVKDFSPYFPEATIISGLAYGIDGAAHKAAIDNNLATVAVVAHGLDTIYPSQHRDLARKIINSGGAIVSEYPTNSRPFQRNFLQRNRIVAGLSEATIVVESEVRGGAMSTANQAFCNSREVFAVPGRVSDVTSGGCNMLIARSKANIFTSVPDFMNVMGWKIPSIGVPAPQKSLFPELEGEMAAVYKIIHEASQPVSIDEIHLKSSLSMPSLMSALTDLEFEGIIVKLPGARYEEC